MRITASRDGGDAHVFTVTETGVDLDEEELTLSFQSVDVRFQGPATNPAGAEDVTNMWDRRHGYVGWHVTDLLGKRHGYAGHGYVACMVVLG